MATDLEQVNRLKSLNVLIVTGMFDLYINIGIFFTVSIK